MLRELESGKLTVGYTVALPLGYFPILEGKPGIEPR